MPKARKYAVVKQARSKGDKHGCAALGRHRLLGRCAAGACHGMAWPARACRREGQLPRWARVLWAWRPASPPTPPALPQVDKETQRRRQLGRRRLPEGQAHTAGGKGLRRRQQEACSHRAAEGRGQRLRSRRRAGGLAGGGQRPGRRGARRGACGTCASGRAVIFWSRRACSRGAAGRPAAMQPSISGEAGQPAEAAASEARRARQQTGACA